MRMRTAGAIGGTIVMALVATSAAPAGAADHEMAQGLIIRYEMGLIYIDVGQNQGVMKGDLYDVLSSEILAHPLTGDTLAVTPKRVGAIQVYQVLPRMSVAKLVHMMPGEDPLLKPIARVRDPERLAEVEHYMKRAMFKASGTYAPRRLAIFPGIYQMQTGAKRKGWMMLGVEAASLIGAIAYRTSSNDWYDQYQNLPNDTSPSDFDFYYTEASDRRATSNRLFWIAGAVYVYNWIDVLWMGGTANLASSTSAPRTLGLGLRQNSSGTPMLTMAHSF